MPDVKSAHPDLQAIAKQVMLQRGFQPEFPPEVTQQLSDLKSHPPDLSPAKTGSVDSIGEVRDLRSLLWSSIDNDTSRDLDQIEVVERQPNGDVKVLVGIADVDAFVQKQT